jgi:hypothetical protein
MSMVKNPILNKKRKNEDFSIETDINQPNKKKKLEFKFKESKESIISIAQNHSKLITEDWKNKQTPDLIKYCESIGINAESNYELLTKLVIIDFDLFLKYYSKYQFTLEIRQRKEIQKLIKDFKLNSMIKNNFIKSDLKSIRELFLKVCDLIINIKLNEKDCLKKLKNEIISIGVFIEDDLDFLFPVNFGNIELKFNKLIIDVLFFIFGKNMGKINSLENNKKDLIKTKISLFKKMKLFFQKSGLYDDETLFKISDYLINCYYIYFEVDDSLKNFDNLEKIITCCLPFELDTAVNFIEKYKYFSYDIEFKIENITLNKYYTSNLTKDSKIKLSFDKKIIEVKAEDVNWNLKHNMFFQLLKSDNFTFCFRFPKLSEINYIYINNDIRNNYKALFRKILKSKIMEQCMNIDSDTNNFNYPFNDDNIIQELEDHTLFVPFPAKKFYGYSDKKSFTIFLNSYINTSDLKSIFIDFDNLLKSEFHEIKNIYRLYMHINDSKISLRTPEIKRKTLLTNEFLKNNLPLLNENKNNLEEIYKEKLISKNENDSLDYGDILEFAMNGDKQEIFFIKGSLFCLTEKNWEKEPKEFFELYFKACKEKKFKLNPTKDDLFIKSIMKFFNLKRNVEIINETYTEKRADYKSTDLSLEGEIENSYVVIPKVNHCRMKK